MAPKLAKTAIYLNVYDLANTNQFTSSLGLGVYHSGIEIAGDEYTFAQSVGIFSDKPKVIEGAHFKESIELGMFQGSRMDALHIVNSMKSEYPGNSYDLITRNCNTFSNELSERLLGISIPPYINRLAYLGSFIRCLIPSNPNLSGNSDKQQQHSTFPNSFKAAKPSTIPFTGTGNRLGGNNRKR